MMQESAIPIRNALDVVTARVHVREVARQQGLSLTDQARISMATSSLASQLFSGDEVCPGGQITIECLRNGHRVGLRVICRWQNLPDITVSTSNERWMVDEVVTHEISGDIQEVVLTKWSEL